MNNDIKFEIAKYLNSPIENTELDLSGEIDYTLKSREFLIQKITYTSKTLNRKLKDRPSLEDLKNKNIIRNELVLEEIKNEVSNLLIIKTKHKSKDTFIAPSISNLVKKMDFEYKKIVIIHKLNIKRKN